MDLDFVFHLPDEKFRAALSRRKLHHRQKREIWERFQEALYLHNFDGYSCLLKSVCEAKLYILPPGRSLVHDLLRVVFSAPVHEDEFREEMGGLYEKLYDPSVCETVHECPISILQFMLLLNKQKY
ncbi:uncharacterized protein LOC113234865 [Hyposmocoma kahamanoa]|uniref:uncharacterized protein LOC113234865 n=1 Tax=Hyposmocoma kahamanoa TaxID=1477025 RepID=UPI000E6D750F|nr:uncharacterized protein LOC113234865 [Hyposmocoma kahamanoa]